jgi:multiple sugar transport system permease protein
MALASASPRSAMTKQEKRNMIVGLLFVSPWILGFLLFAVYPLIASMYYSMTNFDFIREPQFIGLKNYERLFTSDPDFKTVLYNTFYYVGFAVPLGIAISFLIANMLNGKLFGRSTFRGLIYVPAIMPAMCTAIVWLFLLNVQYGAINGVLKTIGWPTIPFLSNPDLSKPTLIVIYIWLQGAAVTTFLAALQDVPRSLYEAADLDGASRWQQFWRVTVPMCTPVILFNLIMGIIIAFQEFTVPWMLTQGGPMKSTELYAVNLYRNGFIQLSMGKASAMAWILFVIIMVFTAIMFRTSARWVYYGGEK